MKALDRGGLVPGFFGLLALLCALASLVEALANRRQLSLAFLPSYERLLEATWLALGFAVLVLLWQIRAGLIRRGD